MGATVYWIRETTPLYTADALIAIETRPLSIVRVVQVDQAIQDTGGDAAQINTELAVLQSRGLAARIIRALGLDKDSEFGLEAATSDGFFAYATHLLAFASSALNSAKSFLAGARAGDNAPVTQGAGSEGERLQSADLLGETDERESPLCFLDF